MMFGTKPLRALKIDRDRSAALGGVGQRTLETRCAMAQLYRRRGSLRFAASALKDLDRPVFDRAPLSLPGLRRKTPQSEDRMAARKVLQEVIEAYAEPKDAGSAPVAGLAGSVLLPSGV